MNGPLSPAVISKLPLGLLGFFGIKNGGQYPQSLGGEIAPTIDLWEILAANYNERFAASAIAAANFQPVLLSGVPLVVPPAELWFVSAVSINGFTGVGDSFTATAVARGNQTGSASKWPRAISNMITQGASLNVMHPGWLGNGIPWFGPGDDFGVQYSAFVNASGTAQVGIDLQITRFPF